MKKYTLLILILSFTFTMAQNTFDYSSEWKKIEKLETNGLNKSLLPLVQTIYQQAKKDQNSEQLIRALFYQSKILQSTSDNENIEVEIIRNFENEIQHAKGTDKSFLESILAELYANYYESNSWTIMRRTETEEKTTDDFRFWTRKSFQQNINELYLNSIKGDKSLKSESIENWKYLLLEVPETHEFRPTLYDFLAYRIIDYFQSETNSYTRSTFDSEYEEFKKNTITQIFTDLISFHSSKNQTSATAYNELKFLQFKKSDMPDDEFEKKLIQLSEKYSTNSFTPYILMELAMYYQNKSNGMAEKDFAKRKENLEKSIHYLDQIITKTPKTDMSNQAENMKKQIHAPDFGIQIEKYVSPNLNVPIVISHKNLNTLYFKVLRFNDSKQNVLNDYRYAKENEKQKQLNAILSSFPLETEFAIDVKNFDDYQSHSTLAKINPLKAGQYLVLVSNNSDFKINEDFVLKYQNMNVSTYSVVFRDVSFLITNRETGLPVTHKNVDVFEDVNNKTKKVETVKTDEFGLAKISRSTSHYKYLHLKIEGEEIAYSTYFYGRETENEKRTGVISQIFTDRAIYRPGQTVYFKVIHYQIDKDESKTVLKNYQTNVSLMDANHKLVTNLSLVTNEFGSVSGEFVLPAGGLTGEFSIKDTNSNSYYFSVEEYKRPKFEVKFDKVEDLFKLDEEVISKGKAIAYSGANIDNAKVAYRVYRQALYPYRPWWMRDRFPSSEPAEELINGETITDSDGNFKVIFQAKPAPAKTNDATQKSPRTYTYRIVAEVTDINGETHSSEQSITVGDLRYRLEIPLNDKIEITTFDSLVIQTQNLNGEFAAAKGKITLTKINPPQRVLRDSPLPPTDYQIYSKEEFISYFPHEAYGDENQKENWKQEKPVLEESFDTRKSKIISIKSKKWKEGYYILKGFIVDGKDTIPTEKLIYLYNNRKKDPVDNEIFSIQLDQEKYKPGDVAIITIASATKDSEALIQLEVDGKIVKTEKLKLNNSYNSFQIPIKEEYRGNVFVHYYFGKFNTAQAGKLTIYVPHEDSSLKITAGTLRDKLQPGQKEVWELTISGKDKDKVMAEMLTTMYDASLDQFRSNSIDFPTLLSTNYSRISAWDANPSFGITSFNSLITNPIFNFQAYNSLAFSKLNWFGFYFGLVQKDYMVYNSAVEISSSRNKVMSAPMAKNAEIDSAEGLGEIAFEAVADAGGQGEIAKEEPSKLDQVVARKALQETAFFYPNLRTDEKGNIKIQFTVPESLTAWKFMAVAHTPEMNTGYFTQTVVTQKDLMVVPNPPRFLREGDHITFSSKIINLSDKELKGQAKLLLFDAFTMQPVDVEFGNTNATQNFTVVNGKSDEVSWDLKIPTNHQAIVYRIVASAGDFSDGEESALPILSNRMMVTETMPISVREGQTKTFTFDKLKNNSSNTLENFKLTFEMTTNPIWYAIFSLPYLREYPYECSEQIFARLYGNLISQHLVNSNPKIKAVFNDWNQKGELKSKLEQNQELKALLLEETPWVRQSESEEEQMKRIAVLFDLNQMSNELSETFRKLQSKQSSNGGFPWFEGGNDSRYITTHIVSGFGHLQKMGINLENNLGINPKNILSKAIQYIDSEMEKEYDIYVKNTKFPPSKFNGIQYMYARSYFLKEYPLSKKGNKIREYFLKELDKDKFDHSLQIQSMLSMIFYRYGEKSKAENLLKSIKDNAVESDEMGMYWKSNQSGWYWYQAPVETQALLIEAFDEVLKDTESVESMKVWLLKNRQTKQWHSTKATTEAVFALLSTGKDWMSSEDGISVKIGNEELDLKDLEKGPQSGTGYVKTSWTKTEIKPEMAKVEVHKTSPGVAWGAMYWQYFEDLDKITDANTNVRFKKELFLKKNSSKGPILIKITENTPIQIGDLVTVRLEIQTDRDMEFVHIKDMRASGFEPTNVMSSYKWKDGLGYYESTRDAATNFFIDYLRKGTYVFEYDVRANNSGKFSNGITTLQNMYAPELSAHSEGIRVEIK